MESHAGQGFANFGSWTGSGHADQEGMGGQFGNCLGRHHRRSVNALAQSSGMDFDDMRGSLSVGEQGAPEVPARGAIAPEQVLGARCQWAPGEMGGLARGEAIQGVLRGLAR